MRLLVIAPFERGRGHGGSQRATALAERLEERGVAIEWEVVGARSTRGADKLRAAARLEPALCGLHEPLRAGSRDCDAGLVAHSYLVPACRAIARTLPLVVDFHNLEWRHLADAASRSRPARLVWEQTQVVLMRRLERRVVARAPLSLFVSEPEFDWACAAAPNGSPMLVPTVLPRAAEDTAAAIAAARMPEPGHLVYVGTLTFPPNMISLRRFLTTAWPRMRRAAPGLRLTVAGQCPERDRAEFNRLPGVRAIGFVEDLRDLLASAAAVVMPFEGMAGTSLRALFYALSELPAIATPAAFRGVPFAAGRIVRADQGWAAAATALAAGELAEPAALARARVAAQVHQRSPQPWDHLHAALTGVVRDAPDAGRPRV